MLLRKNNVGCQRLLDHAISQTVLKQLPAGVTPLRVLEYDASSVPVLELQIGASKVHASELQAVANLVAAVGGGWSRMDLPHEDGSLPFNSLSVIEA